MFDWAGAWAAAGSWILFSTMCVGLWALWKDSKMGDRFYPRGWGGVVFFALIGGLS